MADLDGDGITDIVSGSGATGSAYMFRGLEGGAFAAAQRIPDFAAGASSVAAKDWDGDGRVDLLVGHPYGEVFLLVAFGPREERPAFARGVKLDLQESEPVPHTVAAPLVVDWDGDGVDDLLVGYGYGPVVFYKGFVEEGEHRVETGQVLLQPAYAQEPEELARSELSGALEPVVERSHKLPKLAACDWNVDGKLDLLVGDDFSAVGPAPPLDAQQFLRLQELRKQESEVAQLLAFARRPLRARVERELGPRETFRADPGEWQCLADERMEELVAQDETCRELGRKFDEVSAQRAVFDAPRVTRGYVWVYLRK